jgi:hypothetical protein
LSTDFARVYLRTEPTSSRSSTDPLESSWPGPFAAMP